MFVFLVGETSGHSDSDIDGDYELIKPGMTGHGKSHRDMLLNIPHTQQVHSMLCS